MPNTIFARLQEELEKSFPTTGIINSSLDSSTLPRNKRDESVIAANPRGLAGQETINVNYSSNIDPNRVSDLYAGLSREEMKRKIMHDVTHYVWRKDWVKSKHKGSIRNADGSDTMTAEQYAELVLQAAENQGINAGKLHALFTTETGAGRYLTTDNNIGNHGNDDHGNRVGHTSMLDSMIKTASLLRRFGTGERSGTPQFTLAAISANPGDKKLAYVYTDRAKVIKTWNRILERMGIGGSSNTSFLVNHIIDA